MMSEPTGDASRPGDVRPLARPPSGSPSAAAVSNLAPMEPVGLGELLEPIRRRLWLVVACALLAGGVAYLYAASRPATYEAEAQILLKPDDPAEQLDITNNGDVQDRDRYAESQRAIIASAPVLEAAASSLDVDELSADITSSLQPGTDVLSIFASDSDPVVARDTADAVAGAYIENRRVDAVAGFERAAAEVDAQLAETGRELEELSAQDLTNPVNKARFDASTALYQRLLETAQQLDVNKALQRGSGELIAAAEVPAEPENFGTTKIVLGAGVLGAALGVVAAVLMARYDNRLRSRRDIDALGMRVLARVPDGRRRGRGKAKLAAYESSGSAEAYRSLRSVLQFVTDQAPHRSVAIAGVEGGSSRAYVTANLSVSFAQAGMRTLLVASDLREATVAGLFGQEHAPGLSDLINSLQRPGVAGSRRTQTALPVLTTFERDLWILPPGSSSENPAEILSSPALRQIAADASEAFDMVIYDTSPLRDCADAALVARCAVGVVLTALSGTTTSVELRDAKEVFDVAGVPVLGVVMIERGRRGFRSRSRTTRVPAP